VTGMTPEEIIIALPHLTLPQIHARLSPITMPTNESSISSGKLP